MRLLCSKEDFMEKRITIIYYTILFLSVFSSVIILCTIHNTPYSKYTDNTVLCWNNIVDKEDNSDKIVYTTILPDDISNKIIAFNSLHSSVNVFIDGNLIYTLKPLKNSFIKTSFVENSTDLLILLYYNIDKKARRFL